MIHSNMYMWPTRGGMPVLIAQGLPSMGTALARSDLWVFKVMITGFLKMGSAHRREFLGYVLVRTGVNGGLERAQGWESMSC